GIGVLYGKKELLNNLDPFLYGGDMISEVSFHDAMWNELPWKFEAGTPQIAEAIGFALEINYVRETINDIAAAKLNQTIV
ncbi:MAG: aminotransferase class V-fold PLP-dependent enzyme, partial [Nanoarchaeota archaeon]